MTNASHFSQSLRQLIETLSHRSLRDWSRFVKASGLSMPQFFLLMYLRHHQHCGISDLGEHMEITNAAASQLVDKLVHTGLLVRMQDPHDRRAKQVSLSPSGVALVEKGIAERSRWVDDLAASLKPDDRSKVTEALKILDKEAKKLDFGTPITG